MNIIVKDKNRIKGRSVTEFQKNLVSEGYPPEVSGAKLEQMKYLERKHGPGVFRRK